MKRIISVICLCSLISNSLVACNSTSESETDTEESEQTFFKMNITINDKTLTANMVENTSTIALKRLLEQGSVTYTANDYGNFEKVGNIGHTLPQNNTNITTTVGDVILYQGSDICIYYDTNTWNFTRLGKIEGVSQSELKNFLNAGGGSVSITLSLATSTGINKVNNSQGANDVYDLSGKKLAQGNIKRDIYIKDGKKIVGN